MKGKSFSPPFSAAIFRSLFSFFLYLLSSLDYHLSITSSFLYLEMRFSPSRILKMCEVEQSEGSTFLANKDLLPVPLEERLWKAWNYWTFW